MTESRLHHFQAGGLPLRIKHATPEENPMTGPAAPLSALAGDYVMDPSHSRLGFVARHAMFAKVHGQFNGFEGSGHFAPDSPADSRAHVTIQVSSLDTGNAQRDEALRSDFFAAAQFPQITFTSTAVRKIDSTHCRVNGDLTIKGTTKPVTVEFEYTGSAKDPKGATRVGFTGTVTVNRKDWGMTWNAMLETGGLLVSDNVTLELDIAAIRLAPDG
jgi:polyisoprenoid-binding protein YceI